MSTTVFKKKKVATDEIAVLVLRLSYVLEPLGELYKHPSFPGYAPDQAHHTL